jgi:glucose-6-phosphate isomerase
MNSWKNFQKQFYTFDVNGTPFSLDLSRALLPRKFLAGIEPKLQKAYKAMADLEAGVSEEGKIANPDENRLVGHYWLRDADLAPDAKTKAAIRDAIAQVETFTAKVHSGEIRGEHGAFENLLCIGIGGSALGPQLAAQALGQPGKDKLTPYFFDNTDPDGFDYVFDQLAGKLGRTLVIITSKSGGTIETKNGMKEAAARYAAAKLDFSKHAVVVTGLDVKTDEEGNLKYESELNETAVKLSFLERFPMWDWVGGRTSELAAVGLLPAALQGLDIHGLLEGAAAMDKLTRSRTTAQNPAALLAASWYRLTKGRGAKDMVILPYKDRLLLFARYLQQLVMESLGKRLDLDGNVVEQGISVYGNKGTTDQHAYVQQLRDGVPNFFATFIEVLRDREGAAFDVNAQKFLASDSKEPAVPFFTSGDYLQGFFLGTRFALSGNDRASITLTIESVNAKTLGLLIALFERTVGLYASLVGINAYHQPGVEAGKRAANLIIAIEKRILEFLYSRRKKATKLKKISDAVDVAAIAAPLLPKKVDAETVNLVLEAKEELIFKLCEHLAANPAKRITKQHHTSFQLTTYTHV